MSVFLRLPQDFPLQAFLPMTLNRNFCACAVLSDSSDTSYFLSYLLTYKLCSWWRSRLQWR